MSGWDEAELQRLLDTCENESEAANPDAFCSDHLTYRGKARFSIYLKLEGTTLLPR